MKIRTAAITGARGMIGSIIVNKLVNSGWNVKVLTRSNRKHFPPNLTVIQSNINNEDGLQRLLEGVDAVFHCAAELREEAKMYSTNVEGTRKLLTLLANTKASYFCYLSSAGVIGPTSVQYVTEDNDCHPKNLYEKTKYESELLVKNANLNMSVCILRPTNVVSSSRIGILSLPILNGWKEKIKVHLKGKESAHIIYAEDVANAALFFLKNIVPKVNIYFVSIDDDEDNTVISIYNLYQSICNKKGRIRLLMPDYVPYFLRKIYRGDSMHGRVRFSNEKIKKQGFVFEYGVRNSLNEIYKLRGI